MKTSITIALLLILCGCSPKKHDLQPSLALGEPPAGVSLDLVKTPDAELLLNRAMDWRTWRFEINGVQKDSSFTAYLALRRLSDGMLDVLANYPVGTTSDVIELKHVGELVIAVLPSPLEGSIFRSEKLMIRFIASAPVWVVGSNTTQASGGTNQDFIIPNYHLEKGGGAMGFLDQGSITKKDSGHVILDRGADWELILYLKK
jgi:hypothetical protein